MEREIICLDTSVLLDYFRKKNKMNSYLFKLSAVASFSFAVSIITKYEIYSGANEMQKEYWDNFFQRIEKVIPYDDKVNKVAVAAFKSMKRKNNLIGFPDLIIGCTANAYHHRIATSNTKHFRKKPGINIIDV